MPPDLLHYWHVKWSNWQEVSIWMVAEHPEIPNDTLVGKWIAMSRTRPLGAQSIAACRVTDGDDIRHAKKEAAYQTLLAYLRGGLREDQHHAA